MLPRSVDLVLISVVALLAAACASSHPTATDKRRVERVAATEPMSTNEEFAPPLSFRESEWSPVKDIEALGLVADRYAVLMGVSTYLHAPRIPNLPWVRNDLDSMRQALVDRCGFRESPDRVVELRDGDFTLNRIRQAVVGMAGSMRGEGNMLLLYFSGHGLVNAAGERVFLRRDADPDDPTSSESAISETVLKGILDEAKTVAEAHGATIHRLVILDCCYVEDAGVNAGIRPKKGSFAGAMADPRPMAEAILSACQPDQASQDYNGRISLFTWALTEAIDARARYGAGTLSDVFQAAREATVREQSRQVPSATPENLPLLDLIDRKGIGVRIEVRSGLTDAPVPGATIDVRGEARRSPATFRDLAPGRYPLTARAPGHFPRFTAVDVDRSRDGQALLVRLTPAFAVITGRVLDSFDRVPGHVSVGMEGEQPEGFLSGFHRSQVGLDPGTGAFQLVVPSLHPGNRLILTGGLTAPLSIELPPPVSSGPEGEEKVPRVDLGIIRFDTGEAAVDPRFRSQEAETSWNVARQYLDRGDLELGLASYRKAEAGAQDDDTRRALNLALTRAFEREAGRAFRTGAYRKARSLSSQALGVVRAEFSEAIRDIRTRAEEEDVPAECREKFEEAEAFMAAGRLIDAEPLYEAALDKANVYYGVRIARSLGVCYRQNFLHWNATAFEEDLAGHTERALSSATRALRYRPGDPALRKLVEARRGATNTGGGRGAEAIVSRPLVDIEATVRRLQWRPTEIVALVMDSPENDELWGELGFAYARYEDTDALAIARSCWSCARLLDPQDSEWKSRVAGLPLDPFTALSELKISNGPLVGKLSHGAATIGEMALGRRLQDLADRLEREGGR